ncbi:MAG: undecaprenyl-diphosphate phosphatase [Halofilum sp. (in: g-proteobacteria)]|nr:undecaprenyl-diphosphate phosphatase [Halofilum sp. (in: g-proteobacteria)]
MDPLQLIVLALVQGITEFLPISSSAHLILVPVVTDWRDQGLAFDIAVHVGTLLAVLLYFRAEVARMVVGGLRPLRGQAPGTDGRLAWLLVLATIPVGLAGLLFKDTVETVLRAPAVIAWASIGFGLLLWAADRFGPRLRAETTLGWQGALAIGLAQALALIPGTSRSGVTMTAALALGLDRVAAARFSFLLSIPVIALSGGLQVTELFASGAPVAWGALLAATLLAGASAWLCIRLFLAWIARIGMLPFVLYRVALGVVLLAVFAG